MAYLLPFLCRLWNWWSVRSLKEIWWIVQKINFFATLCKAPRRPVSDVGLILAETNNLQLVIHRKHHQWQKLLWAARKSFCSTSQLYKRLFKKPKIWCCEEIAEHSRVTITIKCERATASQRLTNKERKKSKTVSADQFRSNRINELFAWDIYQRSDIVFFKVFKLIISTIELPTHNSIQSSGVNGKLLEEQRSVWGVNFSKNIYIDRSKKRELVDLIDMGSKRAWNFCSMFLL